MVAHSNSLKGFYLPSFEFNYKIKIAYFLGKIRNFLPSKINSFKTRLISNSRDPIHAAFFQSEGVLVMLKETDITKQKALSLHPHALESLNATIDFHKKIKSLRHYLDDDTIQRAEMTVDNYYELESYIRNIAYSDAPLDKNDDFINRMASDFSKKRLYSFDEV